MLINTRDLIPGEIVEIDYEVSHANKGRHLARFVDVRGIKDDQSSSYSTVAAFDVITTVGIERTLITLDKDYCFYTWSNEQVTKRTKTKWRKKLAIMQSVAESINDVMNELEPQN